MRASGLGSGTAVAARHALRAAPVIPASRRNDDALAILAGDHAHIAALFARFSRLTSNGPQKAALVERIGDALLLHARVEEEIFYPSIRALVDAGPLMDEASIEHETARALIGQLRSLRPGDFRYDARVTVLGEYTRHHADCEERRIFPRARRCGIDLVALGRALKARKRQLQAHAGAATAAPPSSTGTSLPGAGP